MFVSLFALSRGGFLSLITVRSNCQSAGPATGKVALGLWLPSRELVVNFFFLSQAIKDRVVLFFFAPNQPGLPAAPVSEDRALGVSK